MVDTIKKKFIELRALEIGDNQTIKSTIELTRPIGKFVNNCFPDKNIISELTYNDVDKENIVM